MKKIVPTRAEALELFQKYNKSESLLKHALTVESVMRHFAAIYDQQNIEKWGIVGLIHDLDYEMFPEQHCLKVREILSKEEWPEDYIHAIESHGWGLCADVEPELYMEKVLFTIDELTGLITAAALLRPSKSVLDLEVKSVKKKWKDARFAAGVNREVIVEGTKMLELELEFVIAETIKGMREAAAEIGLKGNL